MAEVKFRLNEEFTQGLGFKEPFDFMIEDVITGPDGRKYNIACSQIDIGNAATPMTERMKKGVPQANGSTIVEPTFDVNHVAEVVLNISNFPLETNVQFITIMATKMPYIGRG